MIQNVKKMIKIPNKNEHIYHEHEQNNQGKPEKNKIFKATSKLIY